MRFSNKYILFSVTLILVVFFSGCRSKKNTITIDGIKIEKSQKELLSDIVDKELQFNTVSGKTKFEVTHVNSGKSIKLSSVIKIKRDEIIQISLRAYLGLEVAVVTVTPDSLYIVDRYNKQFGASDIHQFASSNSTFNYYNLQAMLTNRLFLPGESAVSENLYNKYDLSVASNMYLLKTKDQSKNLYNFAIDGNDRIASTLIYSPDKYTLQWSYKDFIKDEGYVYPTTMLGKVEAKNNRLDVKIAYDKLDINKDLSVEIPSPDPKKYKRGSAISIIKQYLGIK